MKANEKACQGGNLAGLDSTFSPPNYTPSRTESSLAVLRDSVTAAELDKFTHMAILAAADSYAKARVRDEFAAFLRELDGGSSRVSS